MRLIIDIDDKRIKGIKLLAKEQDIATPYPTLEQIIANGIPLDDVLDTIRAEIEQAADKQFQIAMGVSDLNERYAHIQMENAYRHSLNIIDKYMERSEE